MIKEYIPAGKQGINKNHSLHNGITSKVFNASCVGDVVILTGLNEWNVKYIIEYVEQPLEFDYEDLLKETAFNKKCLALGLPVVSRSNWHPFINIVIEKAVKYDERDYPPYVEAAKEFCRYLLNGKFDNGDSVSEGYYSHPALLRQKCDIKENLLARILEKNGIKVADEYKQVKDCVFSIWTLDPVRLKEFGELFPLFYRGRRWILNQIQLSN